MHTGDQKFNSDDNMNETNLDTVVVLLPLIMGQPGGFKVLHQWFCMFWPINYKLHILLIAVNLCPKHTPSF